MIDIEIVNRSTGYLDGILRDLLRQWQEVAPADVRAAGTAEAAEDFDLDEDVRMFAENIERTLFLRGG